MGIRNSAKAIILHDGKLLLNKIQNSLGAMYYGKSRGEIYYDLPGGGQIQYETLEETVKRECLEECGCTVAVERLAAFYEEISCIEIFRQRYPLYAHKLYFVFVCHLTDMPSKQLTEKDLDMLESIWVDLADLKDIPLYPEIIKTDLERILQGKDIINLGTGYIRP